MGGDYTYSTGTAGGLKTSLKTAIVLMVGMAGAQVAGRWSTRLTEFPDGFAFWGKEASRGFLIAPGCCQVEYDRQASQSQSAK